MYVLKTIFNGLKYQFFISKRFLICTFSRIFSRQMALLTLEAKQTPKTEIKTTVKNVNKKKIFIFR